MDLFQFVTVQVIRFPTLKIYSLILIFSFFFHHPVQARDYSLEEGLGEIKTQIAGQVKTAGIKSLAILDFTDIKGKEDLFGKYLSEKLMVALFTLEDLKIVERNKLSQVLSEHERQQLGLIDPNTTKKIGRFLGVDALMVGTITDMGTSLELIGRLVHTETARILAVTSLSFIKDGKIERLYQPGQSTPLPKRVSPTLQKDLAMAAGYGNNLDRVKSLLARGADINGLDENGNSVLANAVMFRNRPIIEYLIQQGADINIRDNLGSTPLFLTFADESLFNFLIKNGADVTVINGQGNSALITAARYGQPEVMEALIKMGLNFKARNNKGEDALVAAISSSLKPVEKVGFLLSLGAEVEGRYERGLRPLHFACIFGQTEVVKLLLKKGADVRAPDDNGDNALIWAAGSGKTDLMTFLLDQGMKLNIITNKLSGLNALQQAGFHGRTEMVQFLLDQGMDLQSSMTDGTNTLHLAAMQGHKETVRFLLAKGIDPHLKTKAGKTALMLAVEKGHQEVITILKTAGVKE